jgi:long-subunit fatty acid transport protein
LRALPQRIALASTLLVLALPGAASATVVGTIFSGPTSADPLAAYWNPGAMGLLTGHQLLLFGGATLIGMEYQRESPSGYDGRRYPAADLVVAKPDLAFGFVSDLGLRRLRVGFGFATPVLDGVRWSESYQGRPSSTRYFAVEGRAAHFLLRPAVSYQVHRAVSLGVGLDVTGVWLLSDSMVDLGAVLNRSLCDALGSRTCLPDAPLAREDPTFAGRGKVEGTGWGVGASGGILVEPWPWLRLGLGFASGAREVTVPAAIDVALPPAAVDFVRRNLPSLRLPELRARAEIRTYSPMMLTAGAMVRPGERFELAADLHFIQKSRTGVMAVRIVETTSQLIASQVSQKLVDDAFTVGVRASYRVRPELALAARVELTTNTMPERFTTPVALDFTKVRLQAGLAWRASWWLELLGELGYSALVPRSVSESAFAPNGQAQTPVEASFDTPSPLGSYQGYAISANLSLRIQLSRRGD